MVDVHESIRKIRDTLQKQYDKYKWCLEHEDRDETNAAKSKTDPEVVAEAKQRLREAREQALREMRKKESGFTTLFRK